MSKLVKPAPTKSSVHGSEAITSQNLFVGDLLLPPNFEDTMETLEVEGVDLVLLLFSQGLRFAAVHRIANIDTIDSRFCTYG